MFIEEATTPAVDKESDRNTYSITISLRRLFRFEVHRNCEQQRLYLFDFKMANDCVDIFARRPYRRSIWDARDR